MSNKIYQEYQTLLAKLDLEQVADEVFKELIKTQNLNIDKHIEPEQIANRILFDALQKTAKQFLPPKEVSK